MTALNLTSASDVLKRLYNVTTLGEIVYENNPLLAMVPKFTDWSGSSPVLPLRIAYPQGRSNTFSNAQSNTTASIFKAFLLTTSKNYAIADIDGETIDAMASDEGSYVDAMTSEVNGALKQLGRSLAQQMYRSTTGTLGSVGSGTSSPVTLANIDEIVNFEVGQVIGAVSDNTGSGTVRSGTGTISAVNRSTGVITYTGTITSLAVGDFLYVSGDYNAAMSGLDAWIPSSSPGATTFFGVDRSSDPTRLGGLRYDGSSAPINEGLIQAMAFGRREGANFTHLFLNPMRMKDLMLTQQGQVRYIDTKVGNVGFRGVNLTFGANTVEVYDDPNCPVDTAWFLDMKTLKLCSRGTAPKILDKDGLKIQRAATSDSYQVRCGFYGNLGITLPGRNLRVTVPTV